MLSRLHCTAVCTGTPRYPGTGRRYSVTVIQLIDAVVLRPGCTCRGVDSGSPFQVYLLPCIHVYM